MRIPEKFDVRSGVRASMAQARGSRMMHKNLGEIVKGSPFLSIIRSLTLSCAASRRENIGPISRSPRKNSLPRIFQVSRMTVRQAINKLVSDGMLYRRRGQGDFCGGPEDRTQGGQIIERGRRHEEGGVKAGFDHPGKENYSSHGRRTECSESETGRKRCWRSNVCARPTTSPSPSAGTLIPVSLYPGLGERNIFGGRILDPAFGEEVRPQNRLCLSENPGGECHRKAGPTFEDQKRHIPSSHEPSVCQSQPDPDRDL